MDRISRYLLLWPAVLLIVIALAPPGACAGSAAPTKVTLFNPGIPDGPERSGECWTDSIAVLRPDAWRCTAGNEIHDPCFANAKLPGRVICGADPASRSTGFILKLTKPLPKASATTPAHQRPWLVKLDDGVTCEILTGTIAFVAGLDVPYGCSDSQKCGEGGCTHMTGLTDRFKRGKVWIADKVTFASSAKGLQLLDREKVPVAAVWE